MTAMTELSQKILAEYQIRKTQKQKTAFIELMQSYFPDMQIQEGGFPKSRNLIIGDVENAKVLLTAHYDTCAWLPFPNFITPKAPIIAILYSILVTIPPILLSVILVNFLVGLFTNNFWLHYWPSLAASFSLLALMFWGPANKHTANDNTSGVITLCELLMTLRDDTRSKVAFIFFDNEEIGLVGSSYFRSKYKQAAQSTPLINFDCVSDGDYILVAASKTIRAELGAQLDEAFQPTEKKTILLTNAERVYYPSDQMGFKKSVAVAALKRKPVIGYYMDRIHTHMDVIFDKSNIKLLCDSVLRLLKNI